MTLSQHPLSAAFPAMSATDLKALAEDIALHGLRQSVVVYQGQVLDGWHRYSACISAGVEPGLVELNEEDPVAYVLSSNLSRRHLTASQRAAAVVACATWRELGSNQHEEGRNQVPTLAPTEAQMAVAADVTARTVRHAKAAARGGFGADVRDGKMSAKKAAALASGSKTPREKELPQTESFDELVEEVLAELAAANKIIDSDDRLAAARAETRAASAALSALERLYRHRGEELRQAQREAKRWQKRAEALEAAKNKSGT